MAGYDTMTCKSLDSMVGRSDYGTSPSGVPVLCSHLSVVVCANPLYLFRRSTYCPFNFFLWISLSAENIDMIYAYHLGVEVEVDHETHASYRSKTVWRQHRRQRYSLRRAWATWDPEPDSKAGLTGGKILVPCKALASRTINGVIK